MSTLRTDAPCVVDAAGSRAAGLVWLTLAGTAVAQTPPPDLPPPPPGSVCPAPTVSTEHGNVHAFPGRWWIVALPVPVKKMQRTDMRRN